MSDARSRGVKAPEGPQSVEVELTYDLARVTPGEWDDLEWGTRIRARFAFLPGHLAAGARLLLVRRKTMLVAGALVVRRRFAWRAGVRADARRSPWLRRLGDPSEDALVLELPDDPGRCGVALSAKAPVDLLAGPVVERLERETAGALVVPGVSHAPESPLAGFVRRILPEAEVFPDAHRAHLDPRSAVPPSPGVVDSGTCDWWPDSDLAALRASTGPTARRFWDAVGAFATPLADDEASGVRVLAAKDTANRVVALGLVLSAGGYAEIAGTSIAPKVREAPYLIRRRIAAFAVRWAHGGGIALDLGPELSAEAHAAGARAEILRTHLLIRTPWRRALQRWVATTARPTADFVAGHATPGSG